MLGRVIELLSKETNAGYMWNTPEFCEFHVEKTGATFEIVNHFFVAFPVFSFNVQVFECKVSKLILIRLFYAEEIIAFKINVSHCHMV